MLSDVRVYQTTCPRYNRLIAECENQKEEAMICFDCPLKKCWEDNGHKPRGHYKGEITLILKYWTDTKLMTEEIAQETGITQVYVTEVVRKYGKRAWAEKMERGEA